MRYLSKWVRMGEPQQAHREADGCCWWRGLICVPGGCRASLLPPLPPTGGVGMKPTRQSSGHSGALAWPALPSQWGHLHGCWFWKPQL